jgi:hypothetical protein
MGPTQLLNPTNKTLLSQIEAGEAVPFKNDTSLSRVVLRYILYAQLLWLRLFYPTILVYI